MEWCVTVKEYSNEQDIINKLNTLINKLNTLRENNIQIEKDDCGWYPIDYAAYYGHVLVLEWFKNSGLEMKYSHKAMDYASAAGHVEVLEWFKNSGLEMKFDKDFIRKTKSVEWFERNGLIKSDKIDWSNYGDGSENCVICQNVNENDESKERVIRLKCFPTHTYHPSCLEEWIKTSDRRNCCLCDRLID